MKFQYNYKRMGWIIGAVFGSFIGVIVAYPSGDFVWEAAAYAGIFTMLGIFIGSVVTSHLFGPSFRVVNPT